MYIKDQIVSLLKKLAQIGLLLNCKEFLFVLNVLILLSPVQKCFRFNLK